MHTIVCVYDAVLILGHWTHTAGIVAGFRGMPSQQVHVPDGDCKWNVKASTVCTLENGK